MRSWLHWLVVNIPGKRISEGRVVASYEGAEPPEKMGVHRYVFTVFKQTKKIVARFDLDDDENRGGFNVANFAKQNALSRLVAIDFYTAKNPIQ